ncbi:Nucleolar protein 56 [Plasmodiophora brassicae]|uniref:Nucleolar protein 56 n=1 Tax=Plasmodiophora brassicae TaxID=37360 RepID=A0A0G4ISJ4_PLABS|nr:hypothetical protein PBRA_006344 [Plasmodiophora brassicae]SPQ95195.1 unnamed protein product [Plasmodiophora brassicae]
MSGLYVLYESAAGVSLFQCDQVDEIAIGDIQKSITDLQRFGTMVTLKAFAPFTNAEMALENINAVSEGTVTPFLAAFLEQNLPKVSSKSSKKSAWKLGVQEAKLGGSIQESLSIPCESTQRILEIVRGIRMHFLHYVKGLGRADIAQAQLGLAHSYSRSKVKFNVNRVDNMVIQAIATLDQLDKDLNTFSMRCREWYGWHFPELAKLATDNVMFAKVAYTLGDRKRISANAADNADLLNELTDVTGDMKLAQDMINAGRTSMGTDISNVDLDQIKMFAEKVASLSAYRVQLFAYLQSKMSACAPNLTALIGELVGARLISHAGSLTNLAKYPASTVQILGAEKALFRALKTKGNTPKYGLIFNSTFIGQAAPKNKGRISRYLANKCSMASRIDSFSDVATDAYGRMLKDQVDERLAFYNTGVAPRKNIDVMTEVAESLRKTEDESGDDKVSKKRKKDQVEAEAADDDAKKAKKEKKKQKKDQVVADEAEPAAKKSKKEKKQKKDEEMQVETTPEAQPVEERETETAAPASKDKKKKKTEKKEKAKQPDAQAVDEGTKEKKSKKKTAKKSKAQ